MKPSAADSAIHVVFAADANYAAPLAVAMVSAAVNCDPQRNLVFHVLQSGITGALRDRVENSLAMAQRPNAGINWLEAPVKKIENFPVAHRYTTALTFARLLLPEIMPPEITRLIYLDCDLVVNGDLAELWDVDIGDKALGAVRDLSGVVSDPDCVVNYRELGIPGDAPYFNAGVLIMNLAKWRDAGIDAQVLAHLSDYQDIIRMADQEALNAVLWNDWQELDYSWNWQIPHRDYRTGRLRLAWTPKETSKNIIHFTTGEKPWRAGCDYDEKKYFLRYLDQTDWRGERPSALQELRARLKRTQQDFVSFFRK